MPAGLRTGLRGDSRTTWPRWEYAWIYYNNFNMIWYGCEHPAVLVWLFCPSNFQTIEWECIHVHCLVNKEVIVSKFLCCDRVVNVNARWNAVHFWFESPASGSQSWPHGTESNLRGYHCSENLRKWINVLQVFKPSYPASSKTCRFASLPPFLLGTNAIKCLHTRSTWYPYSLGLKELTHVAVCLLPSVVPLVQCCAVTWSP